MSVGRIAPLRRTLLWSRLTILVATVAITGSACAIKTMAVKTVADTMSHQGDVFTRDVLDTHVEYKYEQEINQIRQRPHPYEFHLYYDI